jgi:hypothetical protein
MRFLSHHAAMVDGLRPDSRANSSTVSISSCSLYKDGFVGSSLLILSCDSGFVKSGPPGMGVPWYIYKLIIRTVLVK